MVKLRKGDKVMIADVDGIRFAKKYFTDGEVTEVAFVEVYLGFEIAYLYAPNATAAEVNMERHNGVPVLVLTPNELEYVIKMLPDNNEEEGGAR